MPFATITNRKGHLMKCRAEPVSIAVALADKLDTLVGFWAIDEKPTGSKDPFALRRAALGVVRLVLDNGVRLEMYPTLGDPFSRNVMMIVTRDASTLRESIDKLMDKGLISDQQAELFHSSNLNSIDDLVEKLRSEKSVFKMIEAVDDLLAFFADRLKQYLRDKGERHDLIDAVFALGEDDLVLITRRVEALGKFLDTDDGANLLAGYKRAANILKAETKKGWSDEGVSVDAKLIKTGPKVEQGLHAALAAAEAALGKALPKEDFTGAMTALAGLRAPVNAFFDGVMVNDEDEAIRANRLALLTEIRRTIHKVADFSKVEG